MTELEMLEIDRGKNQQKMTEKLIADGRWLRLEDNERWKETENT